jgi:hypothetical protein
MRISKRLFLCLSGLLLPSLAWADSVFPSCSKGGFTGTIAIDYAPDGGGARVSGVSYKIKKGKNSGGNRANVYYSDNGSLPAKKFGTSFGKQDNKAHSIFRGGSYSTSKHSGISIHFVFDKSRARDPSCSIYYRIP